jgi:hypothetical protein
MEKRLQKNQENDKNSEENTPNTTNSDKKKEVEQNKEEENDKYISKRQHPLFERKIKVSGNDSFLKQIFS